MIKIYGFGFQETSNKFITIDFMIGSFLRTCKRVKQDVVPMA